MGTFHNEDTIKVESVHPPNPQIDTSDWLLPRVDRKSRGGDTLARINVLLKNSHAILSVNIPGMGDFRVKELFLSGVEGFVIAALQTEIGIAPVELPATTPFLLYIGEM